MITRASTCQSKWKSSKILSSSLLIIKERALSHIGTILDTLIQNEFSICQLRTVHLSAETLQGVLPNRNNFSGSCVIVEVVRDQAIATLNALLGT